MPTKINYSPQKDIYW